MRSYLPEPHLAFCPPARPLAGCGKRRCSRLTTRPLSARWCACLERAVVCFGMCAGGTPGDVHPSSRPVLSITHMAITQLTPTAGGGGGGAHGRARAGGNRSGAYWAARGLWCVSLLGCLLLTCPAVPGGCACSCALELGTAAGVGRPLRWCEHVWRGAECLLARPISPCSVLPPHTQPHGYPTTRQATEVSEAGAGDCRRGWLGTWMAPGRAERLQLFRACRKRFGCFAACD